MNHFNYVLLSCFCNGWHVCDTEEEFSILSGFLFLTLLFFLNIIWWSKGVAFKKRLPYDRPTFLKQLVRNYHHLSHQPKKKKQKPLFFFLYRNSENIWNNTVIFSMEHIFLNKRGLITFKIYHHLDLQD